MLLRTPIQGLKRIFVQRHRQTALPLLVRFGCGFSSHSLSILPSTLLYGITRTTRRRGSINCYFVPIVPVYNLCSVYHTVHRTQMQPLARLSEHVIVSCLARRRSASAASRADRLPSPCAPTFQHAKHTTSSSLSQAPRQMAIHKLADGLSFA